MQSLLRLFVLLLLLSIAGSSFGQRTTVLKNVLEGPKVSKDATLQVRDSILIADVSRLDIPYPVKNIVVFHIDEYAKTLLPDSFTATLNIRVIYLRPDQQKDSVETALTINYKDSAAYTSRSSFVFNNSHDVTVRILGLSVSNDSALVSKSLLLKNEMDVHAVYKLNCTNDAVQHVYIKTTVNTDSTDELSVHWDEITGADLYDLEWTFVDSSALGTKDQLFRNNCSRVTIPGNSYNIPLMYDDGGVVYFRVRAVQVRDNNSRMETSWSDNFSGGLGSYAFVGHQRALNWQSAVTFSEEGKRNVSVTYFDGSMRSRQTVLKDNTTNTTVVSETMYDYQGRGVIDVMPAPTLNTVIKYSRNFNRGLNGVAYDKGQYDTLPSPETFLSAAAAQMSSESGANQYYSANNQQKDLGVNRFIPDAEGYAFTETVYTQDNTGRVSRLGGTGPTFRIGSNHETKFYYDSPGESDLDVLFGTEAGCHSRYFKNSLEDANGQMRVAYTDIHGRTIATALAGTPDSAQLENLESSTGFIVTDTISGNTLKGTSLESVHSQLVVQKGNHHFHYALMPPVFKKKDCDSNVVCYNGLYDLEIMITDDVYNQHLGGKAFDTILHNYNADSIVPNCSPDSFVVDFNIVLERGSYQITKRLTVNETALSYYRDSIFMVRNMCSSLDTFIAQQHNLLVSLTCVPDCQTCLDSLGTWDSFRAKYMLRAGIADSDSASYRSEAQTAYNDAFVSCAALCGTTSPVDEMKDEMEQDLAAPSGQYANVDDSTDIYSIFYHKDENTLPPYKRDTVTYLNENGKVDSVYDDAVGTYVLPQDLSSATFSDKFKPSWAAALLKFHPEYCRYLEYQKYAGSLAWDRVFEAVDTYEEALDSGYLNPMGSSSFPFTIVAAHKDPFASMQPTLLSSGLSNYSQGTGNNALSMYSVATATLKCTTNACIAKYNTPALAFNASSMCTGDLDMAWRAFRQLYLAYKNHIIDSLVQKATCTGYPTAQTLTNAGKVVHFTDQQTAYNNSGINYIAGGDTADIRTLTKSSLSESYAANCQSYVEAWMNQLMACTYYVDTAALRSNLIPQLLQICKDGADEDHVMGASTGRPLSLSSRYGQTFVNTILSYNESLGITDTLMCTGYLIDAPLPYDQQRTYGDNRTYTKPTDCECNNLHLLEKEYETYKKSTDGSFTAYLNRTRGTSLTTSQMDALLTACANKNEDCDYSATQLVIPALIQCGPAPSCTDCAIFTILYNSYTSAHSLMMPSYEDEDSVQHLKNELFASYMNNGLGYSKEAREYLAFRDSCAVLKSMDSVVCTAYAPGSAIHTYGENTFFEDLIITSDGGYLMAGKMVAAVGDTDAVLVKTDAAGTLQWAKRYGASNTNYLTKVRATSDGGYIAIGTSNKSVLLIKMTSTGAQSWTKTLSYNTQYGERGGDIVQTSDGGYIVALKYNIGNTVADAELVALNSSGTTLWAHRYGTNSGEEGYSLTMSGDTVNLLGCTSGMGIAFRTFLMKIDRNTGSILTSYLFYDTYEGDGGSYSGHLYNTPTGHLINMSFTSTKAGGGSADLVAGVDHDGNLTFTQQFGSPVNGATSTQWMPIVPSSDGGYVSVQNIKTKPQAVVWEKVDGNNSLLWSELIRAGDSTEMRAVVERPDGGFAAVGGLGSKGMLMLTLGNGKVGCSDSVFTNSYSDAPIAEEYPEVWAVDVDMTSSTSWSSASFTENSFTASNSVVDCRNCYTVHSGPLLCGNAVSVFPTISLDSTDNCSDNEFFAVSKGTELYTVYRDSLLGSFGKDYLTMALEVKERFTVTYNNSEYNYTLYYYDQAGNLVKTVPPAGVVVNRTDSWLNSVKAARAAGTALVPDHKMVTQYRYNTFNQVVMQSIPDQGITYFWYDRLGRLAFSQNAKQLAENKYTYTTYDALGRISEAGELTSAAPMTDFICRDTTQLNAWMATARSSRTQIISTSYDHAYTALSDLYLTAKNLRNRVSWTAVFDNAAAQDNMQFTTASFYSYDSHGFVDTLLQDYKIGSMQQAQNRFKKVVYRYDLVSGKLNSVAYQPGASDAYYHRYTYDALDRLTNVETSRDSIYWENEAFYQYYKHGGIARVVLGEEQVQGLDYAYNLQGLLKGQNSTTATAAMDMGGDGSSGSMVAKDAFGFALHYYGDRDYKPISGLNIFASAPGLNPLFDGNISAISQTIPTIGTSLLSNYSYDVLSRMTGMQVSKGLNTTTNSWTPVALDDFKEKVTYDANSNILKYLRNGNHSLAGTQLSMDSLTYHYKTGTNKLDFINDSVPAGNYAEDIDAQSAGNYAYDSLGNMIADKISGIDSIQWNVFGKIARIKKSNGAVISYTYDNAGYIVCKTVNKKETWYVRDGSGHVLSIYSKRDSAVNNGDLSQTEIHLYGDTRLGIHHVDLDVQVPASLPTVNMTGLGNGISIDFIRGRKAFELSNHLDNILASVSDRKIGVSTDGSVIDHYEPYILSAQEYYPYGMTMPGRSNSVDTSGYRYGFNGQEKNNDINGKGNSYTAEFWEYDPRIGKRWNPDPIINVSASPYSVFDQNPISRIDPAGAHNTDWYARKNSDKSISLINKSGEHDAEKSILDQNYVNVGEDNISAEAAMNNAQSYFQEATVLTGNYKGNVHANFTGYFKINEQLSYMNPDRFATSPLTYKNILSDPRYAWIKVAISQIGNEEQDKGDNPQITQYHLVGCGLKNTYEDTYWCSSFVNYCLAVGNPQVIRSKSAASRVWFLQASKWGLERVQTPYYGSLMVRKDNNYWDKDDSGGGHVSIVIGKDDGAFAQLGGNQAKPGSRTGNTVNVVLRRRKDNVRYYHFIWLPKIPLGPPLATPATKKAEEQMGLDK
ncbi:hypothetical protein [Chitinophaga sancti]|uniref:TIGR02594 family protein n=1 Tax=Chitinophaga sancti TaxID=1004 RepID=A0A1K1SSL1_9BACT|nr:hypothetical protein [Chitinophaga sancti]WQD65426.1 hypothetical protein U0033_13580 [Chitinophaga sancti]WQG88951.1 hypothetical protein SR876_28890 [Chitinophaga sancti]SFW87305.1 TIGR02594 family protein [Chitinophaga sancti]